MNTAPLQSTIDAAWEERDSIDPGTGDAVRDAVDSALALLDGGDARVAEKVNGVWRVNQCLK